MAMKVDKYVGGQTSVSANKADTAPAQDAPMDEYIVKPSANGGFAVSCMAPPSVIGKSGIAIEKPKTYTFKDVGELTDFFMKTFGGGDDAEDDADDADANGGDGSDNASEPADDEGQQ